MEEESETETEEELRTRTEKKVKKAAQLLFFRRHRVPGVKGWELKKALGDNYLDVLGVLNSALDKFGMEVKRISEEGGTGIGEGEEKEKAERDRFMIVLKDHLIEKASGARIDDVAILSATLAYIISKQGKAPRKEIEDFLADKFPKRRIYFAIDRYISQGYLGEEDKVLYIGWRTRAEVDRKTLLDLILTS
ncbi:MAG: hypothetical protein N2V75_02545 [Methanophagales archaeon]|nr:hypothetical protein [Methanophagales archaeon]RLG33977.1 MAG: hypothetical protein DRN97_03730 [Methanosarcinales archaeon]